MYVYVCVFALLRVCAYVYVLVCVCAYLCVSIREDIRILCLHVCVDVYVY